MPLRVLGPWIAHSVEPLHITLIMLIPDCPEDLDLSLTMDVIIDDFSPEITWSDGWNRTFWKGDKQEGKYRGTEHACVAAGDHAVLRFTGSGFTIGGGGEGGKFSNGEDQGEEERSGEWEWTIQDLDGGTEHLLEIMCGGPGLYIDYMRIHSPMCALHMYLLTRVSMADSRPDEVYTYLYDDRQSQFAYEGAWRNFTGDQNLYHDNTWMVTSEGGAKVVLTMEGTAVQVFGSVNGDHGNYTASVDDEPPRMFQKAFGGLIRKQSRLEQGRHTITLENVPVDNEHNTLSIDYAIVNSTISLSEQEAIASAAASVGSGDVAQETAPIVDQSLPNDVSETHEGSSVASASTQAESGGEGLSSVAIAAICFGVLVVMVTLAGGVMCAKRQKRRRAGRGKMDGSEWYGSSGNSY